MATAALGGVIEIPGIDGKPLQVSIEEGTQSGKRLRLRGRGMPRVRSSVRGDMLVDVMVETPVNLTKKQKELLKAFQGACDEKKTSPESTGFLDKMKDLWKDLTEKQ
jgi:molecular chaperone DnaJ